MTTFSRISIFGGQVGVALLPHKFLICVKKTTKKYKRDGEMTELNTKTRYSNSATGDEHVVRLIQP